jgi:hypothetical protein
MTIVETPLFGNIPRLVNCHRLSFSHQASRTPRPCTSVGSEIRLTARSCLLTILFLSVAMSSLASQGPCTEDSTSHTTSLRHWMETVALGDRLELEKLRWVSHLAGDSEKSRDALQLDLRFLTEGSSQENEDSRFRDFLDGYSTTYGETVPERVFYKLVHECGISRQDAIVTIRIVRKDYVIFTDPATSELAVRTRADRGISKEVPLELPSHVATGQPSALSITPRTLDRRAVATLIDSFLRDYFRAANRRANLPEPIFNPDDVENRDHDHVGFVVHGLKSQVLTSNNYWEEIELSIDLVQAPSGVKLVCHVDGYYAGGIGRKAPDESAYEDMRRSYFPQLKTFTDGLLLQLQKHIEAGSQ